VSWDQPLPVTLTAHVPADATGTVAFYDNDAFQGAAPICNGVASVSSFKLSVEVGTDYVRASYDGDAHYLANTSSPVAVDVAKADRTTGLLLGRTGLMYLPQFTETELGWTLRRDAWGHGYALEAARACVDWAFRDFEIPYLTWLIEPNNERSIRVAGRLGMTPLRNDVFHDRRMIVQCVARDTWLG
jgi:hypothetical protein